MHKSPIVPYFPGGAWLALELGVSLSVAHRLFAFVAPIATFTLLTFFSAGAFAHDAPKLPAHATSAVVRVDAYEHESLGVVVGDGHLVLVPFVTIEVARPGFPHAIVTDASGVRHDAGIAATDRASGLALLAVEQPLTATPLAMSPSKVSDAIDTFAIARYPSSGPLEDVVWSFYPAGTLAARGRLRPAPGQLFMIPDPPTQGSPVVDAEGRLVAIMGASTLFAPSALDISASALSRLDGSSRGRRPLIFYGGFNVPFSFALDGGLWFGIGVSFGARVRDVVELRLDAEFSALVPGAPVTPRAEVDCAKSPCYAGVRGVVTPSIGYRFVVGGVGGARAWPIALTPSIGYALGVQDTRRDNGAPAFDAATPSSWGQVAPGVALSVSVLELRGRVRIPLDGITSPTFELGLGTYF